MSNLKTTIARYLNAGLSALPAIKKEKRPAVTAWKEFQQRLPSISELNLAGADGVCLIAGKVSGNLELIDFDYGGELYEPWTKLVPDALLAKLVVEYSQSGGVHVVYRLDGEVPGNAKLAQGMRPSLKPEKLGEIGLETLIETRGEGGLFLCHPTPGYELLAGDLAKPPTITLDERDTLFSAAYALNEVLPKPQAVRSLRGDDKRPGDNFNERGNVEWYLDRNGWTAGHVAGDGNQHWTRPDKSQGTSATLKDRLFYVFSSNAAPFEAGQAYTPFSVYALLEHNGDYSAAAKTLSREGYGDAPVLSYADDADKSEPSRVDPGPIPEQLLRIPGLVGNVMDYTLETAPYPSIPLAFAGAACLMAFLAGRKVIDPGGIPPNIYLIALADSGSGKNAPRVVNLRIANEAGLISRVGDSFASGQGLEDAMHLEKSMLMQTDEIDGMFQSINNAKDARYESTMATLLRLYSQSGSIFPMRKKANTESAGVINQPCLILFGTAVPKHFYQSLSERTLTNGLVSRMLFVESVTPRVSQDVTIREVPTSIIETAKWWADYAPGSGNLDWENPTPAVVPRTDEATKLLTAKRELCDDEYRTCQKRNDTVGTTIWARVDEHTRKLALIYAVSENHESPLIGVEAAEWASQFATHQARLLLFAAGNHVAENPFDELCLRFMRIIKKSPKHEATRTRLINGLKIDSQTLDKVAQTVLERGTVVCRQESTAGRPRVVYAIAT